MNKEVSVKKIFKPLSVLTIFLSCIYVFAQDGQLIALNDRVAVLTQEIQLLEDHDAIETLQRTYGFYVDKALWSHAADLFTDDATFEAGNSGVYRGKQNIRDYMFSLGVEGPQEGRLIDQMQLQPVIHVSPDGNTAKARWRSLVMAGWHRQKAYWGSIIYENEYRKERGGWKISKLHAYNIMFTEYDKGWARHAADDFWPGQRPEPDQPSTTEHKSYPDKYFVPFHYENPVTGKPVAFNTTGQMERSVSPENIKDAINKLAHRLGRLEDVHNIERLQHIYGYYLDKQQWDLLAGLFTDDGSIEISQRGIYAGKDRVRDNLNLYGEQGVHHGVLHNHIQLQPVVHVAEDGNTANVRSRALSMLGTYGRVGVWGGSVYENEYVKENGVWKFKKDHLFTTMFTTYNEGWAAAPRGAPGINQDNPPDLPPSEVYQAFPAAHMPAFHYPHPVTGEVITLPSEN